MGLRTLTQTLRARRYDLHGVAPLYPFGHGLTYSVFFYSDLRVSVAPANVSVSFTLANVGVREAAEVPQLYVRYPASAGNPPKVLRAFSKVALRPGDSSRVEWTLDDRDLSVWDRDTHEW